jgi:hypothetical protein
MAETAGSPRDILAQTMADGRKVLVPHLAEMLKRSDIKEVDSSEQRRRFNQRAMTPEQEQQLWVQEMTSRGLAELTPGSPEALDIGLRISKQVYPDRWDMLAGEGRDGLSDQALWAWKMARTVEPPAAEQDAEPPAPVEGV